MLRWAVLLLAIATTQLPAAVAVLHAELHEPALSVERVRNMLVGRISTWTDGTPVVVVLVEGQQAVSTLTGRDVGRLSRGWKRLVFAGSAAMPRIATSVAEAVRIASTTPGAILVLDAPPEGVGLQIVPLDIGGN